ncbi:MAG: nitroreductase family protein [Thermodesulfobacteriota bacterium]
MADVLEVIKERRSVRNYQDKAVPEEALNTILEGLRWSPSWANTQCWEVVVVKDPETKQKLQATLAPTNPAGKAMVEAPLVLVLCGQLQKAGYYKGQVTTKLGDWFLYDLGIATQSLCLAAQALGLGTVVVGLFDQEKAKAVLGVPEGYELVSMIPLGYPEKVPAAPKRREISEFVHKEKF